MTAKNRYYLHSKISEAKFRQIVRHFALWLVVNGIESFWSFAKRRLAQFNGIAKQTFDLHLKECEFRSNHRHQNLYTALLKLLREQPL